MSKKNPVNVMPLNIDLDKQTLQIIRRSDLLGKYSSLFTSIYKQCKKIFCIVLEGYESRYGKFPAIMYLHYSSKFIDFFLSDLAKSIYSEIVREVNENPEVQDYDLKTITKIQFINDQDEFLKIVLSKKYKRFPFHIILNKWEVFEDIDDLFVEANLFITNQEEKKIDSSVWTYKDIVDKAYYYIKKSDNKLSYPEAIRMATGDKTYVTTDKKRASLLKTLEKKVKAEIKKDTFLKNISEEQRKKMKYIK